MVQKHIFLIIIFFTSLLMGVMFYYSIDMPRTAARQEMHADFMSNNPEGIWNAGNSSNYRVLAPFSVDIVIRFFNRFMSYQRAFLLSFGLFDIAAIFFSLYAFFRYLIHWFAKEKALIIVLFAAILWVFTFKNQTYHPWSLLEFGLFSLGLTYLYEKRFLPFVAVLALATLNRNTSVFLIPAFFFATVPLSWHLREYKKFFIDLAALFAVYFSVMYGLSLWRAFPIPALSDVIQETLASNLQIRNLVEGVINVVLFLTPVLFLALQSFREKPIYLRRLTLVAAVYLPFFIAFMRWVEVRGLIIMFPFLLPLLLVPDKTDTV